MYEKEKRRIKRFIQTGKPVHRVRATADPKIFEYVTQHHVKSIKFKVDKIGRLRLCG